MGTEKNISSSKYQGVRYKKLSNGDIAYYIRFTKDNQRQELKVGTKFEGWTEKMAYNEKIKRENSDDLKNKPLKFKEVVDRFLELQKLHLKKKSYSNINGRIKHLEGFNNKNINEITQKDMNDLIIELSERLANNSINQVITVTKQILKFAEDEFNAKNQNLNKVRSLKTDDARERFLTKDEVKALKEVLKNHYEYLLFVNLSLCTGARLMSVLSIKKKDIDLKSQTITLRDFKNSSNYRGYLNKETTELLLRKWDTLKDEDNVIQKSKRLLTEKLRDTLNNLFNQNNPDNKQKVVIHTLRHTFASHLAIKGVSIQIIQKLLNHKDIKMTMRYSHLMPDSGKDIVKKLWEEEP
ncbi:hypothetical protein BKH42_06965 [Helicobacter sp. 13S00482-2]|uniref:tyrosine-type recombinase/integrase n=1 Tax=Helicobacter sp. 13S00482-2 TaxID=1476200 RepID=UPI000BA7B835|nr:site-specific integrase [Helicobacter sp. 13S00482-2]PAF53261.1 hypothetical protein BKH42_06965 [Helicobacter sp. 13S00482-2]